MGAKVVPGGKLFVKIDRWQESDQFHKLHNKFLIMGTKVKRKQSEWIGRIVDDGNDVRIWSLNAVEIGVHVGSLVS